MWEIVKLMRRMIEGSVLAILLIGVVAVFGGSQTVNLLIADRSLPSILFLLMLAIVLADLIGKLIGILSSTFPDLIPKLDDDALKRASLIRRLHPGQTVALLSGANASRVLLFVVIFALLGASYASVPQSVQDALFGPFRPIGATEAFMREGVAGSISYFLFFLGADDLRLITQTIVTQPLASSTIDGDIFLVGIRLYGLAFVLSVLRTLVTPIVYVRARLRAHTIAATAETAA